MKKAKVLFLVLLLLFMAGCTSVKPEPEEPVEELPAVELGFTEGKMGFDFSLEGLDGKTYTLSEFRGTPIQLVFWSMDCVYCMIELPELQKHYRDGEGYEILAINATFSDGRDALRTKVDELGLPFPVLLMETQEDIQMALDYNVSGIPHNVFIDQDGVIAKVQVGAVHGEEAIQLLKELAK